MQEADTDISRHLGRTISQHFAFILCCLGNSIQFNLRECFKGATTAASKSKFHSNPLVTAAVASRLFCVATSFVSLLFGKQRLV